MNPFFFGVLVMILLSPAVFAGSFDRDLIFYLLFAFYSVLAWWLATVLMIFGMTFLQGFLLGYLIWIASYFLMEDYRRTEQLRKRTPTTQELPRRTNLDPTRFMNLS